MPFLLVLLGSVSLLCADDITPAFVWWEAEAPEPFDHAKSETIDRNPTSVPWSRIRACIACINEAYAGANGTIRRDGDRFVRGDGREVRFWMTQANAVAMGMRPEMQAMHARHLRGNEGRLPRHGHPQDGVPHSILFQNTIIKNYIPRRDRSILGGVSTPEKA